MKQFVHLSDRPTFWELCRNQISITLSCAITTWLKQFSAISWHTLKVIISQAPLNLLSVVNGPEFLQKIFSLWQPMSYRSCLMNRFRSQSDFLFPLIVLENLKFRWGTMRKARQILEHVELWFTFHFWAIFCFSSQNCYVTQIKVYLN